MSTARNQSRGTITTRNRPARTPIPQDVAAVVSSSALPTGAATAARQDTGNTTLEDVAASVSASATNAGATDDAAWDGQSADATLIAIAKRQAAALDELRNSPGGFVPSEPTLSFLVGAS